MNIGARCLQVVKARMTSGTYPFDLDIVSVQEVITMVEAECRRRVSSTIVARTMTLLGSAHLPIAPNVTGVKFVWCWRNEDGWRAASIDERAAFYATRRAPSKPNAVKREADMNIKDTVRAHLDAQIEAMDVKHSTPKSYYKGYVEVIQWQVKNAFDVFVFLDKHGLRGEVVDHSKLRITTKAGDVSHEIGVGQWVVFEPTNPASVMTTYAADYVSKELEKWVPTVGEP